MAAWSWYGPTRRCRSACSTSARPSAIRVGVPATTILVLEPHELAVGPLARRPPRVREQHQREQPQRLRLVGQQVGDDPRQPDRLRAQLAPDERLARRTRRSPR